MRVPPMCMLCHLDCSRQERQASVADAAFGDELLGESPHLSRRALEDADLHHAFVVEGHARGRDAEVVVLLEPARQALGQLAGRRVVNVAQAGHALRRRGRGVGVDDAGAHQVAHGLGAVLIAARRDKGVQFLGKLLIDRDGDALHPASFGLLPLVRRLSIDILLVVAFHCPPYPGGRHVETLRTLCLPFRSVALERAGPTYAGAASCHSHSTRTGTRRAETAARADMGRGAGESPVCRRRHNLTLGRRPRHRTGRKPGLCRAEGPSRAAGLPHRRGPRSRAGPRRHPAQRRGQGQPVLPARLQSRSRDRSRPHLRRYAGQHAHAWAWPGLRRYELHHPRGADGPVLSQGPLLRGRRRLLLRRRDPHGCAGQTRPKLRPDRTRQLRPPTRGRGRLDPRRQYRQPSRRG